jgi:hypothetical protein
MANVSSLFLHATALGVAALMAACGTASSQHGIGGGAGAGGSAGAPSGDNPASGGSASEGGQGIMITGPICPEGEPDAGSACDSTAINCRYDVCGDETSKMFSCRAGLWQVTRACGPLDCPAERPLFLSDCAQLEGIECRYVEDCCGTEPTTQSVLARCEFSQWILKGPAREEACSFCQVHHEDGTACDQPSECIQVGCYWTSCYAQPLVEECVDGVWRSQTLCSK